MIVTMMLLQGCSILDEESKLKSDHRTTEIMDDIEAQVDLSEDAEPLESYASVYKYASASNVHAVYFRPFDGNDSSFHILKSYGPRNGQISLGCPPPDGMRRNERRWVNKDTWLRGVSDGGCEFVGIKYDLASETVTAINCNSNLT